MMPSIRRFLLFNLLLSITITSSITVVGNYFLDNEDIQKQFDMHLSQTTHFLNVLLVDSRLSPQRLKRIQTFIDTHPTKQLQDDSQIEMQIPTQDRFQFQVWSKRGKLLLHSKGIGTESLSTIKEGFSDTTVANKTWRAYTFYNPDLKLTISVAEPYGFREQLEERITWDNLLIILWTYPLLALLIWLTVGKGLNSLVKITSKLATREATDFSPIGLKNIPIEVRPLVAELNELFSRLKNEFDRNKRFSSDAAHELRTPLAALKTQTQVALMAKDEKERNAILNKIIVGADRCTHMVEQLLTLSRLSRQDIIEKLHPVNLNHVAAETVALLVPQALEKEIEIELFAPDKTSIINGDETALSVLIRNLVDNAIRYTPKKGHVEVHVYNEGKSILLKVIDSGPGISPKLRALVFERFYRVLGTQERGSGLGLAIVQEISGLHRGKIKLRTPKSGKGLAVEITFPRLKERQIKHIETQTS